MSAIISVISSCWNFNLDFLCLVGVTSIATFGVASAAGSAAFSDDSILLEIICF